MPTARIEKFKSNLEPINKSATILGAGLMAYVKKSEYGPAEITAKILEFNLTKQLAIAQKGSKITIDGVETISKDLNVKELYGSLVRQ